MATQTVDNLADRAHRQPINRGDVCVIYVSESLKYLLKIEQDEMIQTKYGVIRATDLIGHPYGIKFELKKGWVVPLKLTPELWTQILPHRTQILYQADISMILIQLDIKPGSIVVESGTGSGSLSHAIIRACRPHGSLFTFDLNDFRCEQAQKEFEEHKIGEFVRCEQRNVCQDGFGEDLLGKADACVLDIPQTWEAIGHAYKILKPHGSKLCTFSPCIEQVKQNVAKMTELKMRDIVTLETLLRPYEVREQILRCWDEDILDKLVAIDQKRIDDIKNSFQSPKRITTNDDHGDITMAVDTNEDSDQHRPQIQTSSLDACSDNTSHLQQALSDPKRPFHSQMLPKCTSAYARQFNEIITHSGFLTFATKRP